MARKWMTKAALEACKRSSKERPPRGQAGTKCGERRCGDDPIAFAREGRFGVRRLDAAFRRRGEHAEIKRKSAIAERVRSRNLDATSGNFHSLKNLRRCPAGTRRRFDAEHSQGAASLGESGHREKSPSSQIEKYIGLLRKPAHRQFLFLLIF